MWCSVLGNDSRVPRQMGAAGGVAGQVWCFPRWKQGLKRVEGGAQLWLD